MRIDGQCHCGLISYEAEIDPEKVMICHCTDCQTLTSRYRPLPYSRAHRPSYQSGMIFTLREPQLEQRRRKAI